MASKFLQIFLERFKFYLPFLLPFLIPFSRSIADITIIMVSILFLLNSYFLNDWKWMKEKWFLFALFFWIYCLVLVSPLSIQIEKSFLYSLYFIRWPLFAMALSYWIFSDIKKIKLFLNILSIIVIFLFIDTLWQYFFSYDLFGYERFTSDRLTGPFDRPIIGMWISKLILLIPFIFYTHKYRSKNIINYIFILMTLFLITIFLTGERMALILSIIISFIYILGLIFEGFVSKKRIIIFLTIAFIISLLLYLYEPNMFDRSVFSTVQTIWNIKNSEYGTIFESAYLIWQKYPFFGSGFHTYREACESLIIYGTRDNPIVGGMCFHPHNISLELLSELGIFGFVLFYIMIASIFFNYQKLVKDKNWFLLSFYISILIACFFPLIVGMSIFSNKLASIIWLIIGISLAFYKNYKKLT